MELQIPPSIQPLTTPDTIFLLNKSDLVTHILSPSLSTTSSTTHLKLIPTPTTPIEMPHSQAWLTSLVTNQGTHEFLQGLVEVLKSRYVIHFSFPFCEDIF
jgi:tRNA modification GTPase